MLTAELRYYDRDKVLEKEFIRRAKIVKQDTALMQHDTETIMVTVAELRGNTDECERILAGQSRNAHILRAWKKFREKYPIHYYQVRLKRRRHVSTNSKT